MQSGLLWYMPLLMSGFLPSCIKATVAIISDQWWTVCSSDQRKHCGIWLLGWTPLNISFSSFPRHHDHWQPDKLLNLFLFAQLRSCASLLLLLLLQWAFMQLWRAVCLAHSAMMWLCAGRAQGTPSSLISAPPRPPARLHGHHSNSWECASS